MQSPSYKFILTIKNVAIMYFTIRVSHSGTFETHHRSRRRPSVAEYLEESRSIIDPSSIDELLLLFDFVARPARKRRNDANLFPWLSFLFATTRRTSLAVVPTRHGRFGKKNGQTFCLSSISQTSQFAGEFLARKPPRTPCSRERPKKRCHRTSRSNVRYFRCVGVSYEKKL